jgi:hypothetical protein
MYSENLSLSSTGNDNLVPSNYQEHYRRNMDNKPNISHKLDVFKAEGHNEGLDRRD